jgi:hypothetical protein
VCVDEVHRSTENIRVQCAFSPHWCVQDQTKATSQQVITGTTESRVCERIRKPPVHSNGTSRGVHNCAQSAVIFVSSTADTCMTSEPHVVFLVQWNWTLFVTSVLSLNGPPRKCNIILTNTVIFLTPTHTLLLFKIFYFFNLLKHIRFYMYYLFKIQQLSFLHTVYSGTSYNSQSKQRLLVWRALTDLSL